MLQGSVYLLCLYFCGAIAAALRIARSLSLTAVNQGVNGVGWLTPAVREIQKLTASGLILWLVLHSYTSVSIIVRNCIRALPAKNCHSDQSNLSRCTPNLRVGSAATPFITTSPEEVDKLFLKLKAFPTKFSTEPYQYSTAR
jgi:hypothetical protein